MKYRDKILLLFIFLSYGFNISYLVSEEGRNYLAISAGLISTILFITFIPNLKHYFPWNIPIVLYMLLVCFYTDSLSNSLSVILTFIYSMGYYAVIALAQKSWCNNRFAAFMFKIVIHSYAIVAVIQLIASIAGLPLPNEIGRKEGLSFNSLAMEPSHFGRIVAITFLAYILTLRLDINNQNYFKLIRQEWKIIISIIVSTILSGSSTSLLALPISFILSGNVTNSILIVMFILAVAVIGINIDYEPIQRLFAFVPSLASMDVETVQKADGSGATRVLPLLIYLQTARPNEFSFWLGYGPEGLIQFFLGSIKGIKDYAGQTGFVPGFAVMYGIIGNILFAWTFFINRRLINVMPIILFFMCFFFATPLNTSLMWYALMVISITYEVKNKYSDFRIYRS